MSQLNVGTLNVGTTQFTGDSSTLNTAPPTSLSGFVTGTPSSNQVLMWNGSAWVPAAMGGRLLSMNVYTSQNGTWNSYTTTGGSGTWNKPTGCNNVLVYVTGGGGGARCNDNNYRGAGGGGGGTSIKFIDVSGVSSVNYTYGGGGNYARNGGRGVAVVHHRLVHIVLQMVDKVDKLTTHIRVGLGEMPVVEILTSLVEVEKCHTVHQEKVLVVNHSGSNQDLITTTDHHNLKSLQDNGVLVVVMDIIHKTVMHMVQVLVEQVL